MRTLSSGLQAATGRYHARLVLADGSELSGEELKSLTVTQSLNGSTDRLTLGAAPSATLTCVAAAPAVNLLDQAVRLYLGRVVSGVLEEVPLGVYTITEATAGEDSVTLTGYDAMYTALEAAYFPALTGTVTARGVLADIAAQAGLELSLPAGLADVPLSGVGSGNTMREMAGYMSALLGCNARIDGEGRLALGWFSPSGLTAGSEVIYSGGAKLSTAGWTLGKLECSVTTTSTASETDPEGNTTVSSTDSTVTLTAGNGATGISLSNPWMTQAVLNGIWERIGGLSYRGGTVSLLGDLRYEVGDIITVTDSQGVGHTFPIMAQTIEYDGGLKMTLSAYAASQSGENGAAGPLTQAVSRYTMELAFVKQLMADNLTATNAKIGKLTADAADIKTLVAGKADIDDLTAAAAEIDALAARTAEIEEAYISEAEVGTLLADKATIAQVDTVTGNVANLTSDVANINSLLAGSAGVGALQAIHLTGDNVVIADAIISDAMIGSLSADKLLAGTLYTSLIKIASDENENLLLDGATLQIRDTGGTVRVQIGRDALGDYNLALWNAAGELLWDAAGVYAAGLHDGIIRDVAVAEDAAISGAKLDIASVAEKLNEDGSLVVDSSRVTIDGTRLDVAYQTLVQADAGAAERTSALETRFEVVQGQISSKVWQSDIDTAVGDIGTSITTLTDNYSALTQNVDGITAQVGELETAAASLAARVGTLEVNADSIELSVTAVKQTADAAASDIQTISADLSLKVDKTDNDQIVSMLNASADVINLTSNRLVIDSTNFKLAADGSIMANNASLSGSLYLDDGLWFAVPEGDQTGGDETYFQAMKAGLLSDARCLYFLYRTVGTRIEATKSLFSNGFLGAGGSLRVGEDAAIGGALGTGGDITVTKSSAPRVTVTNGTTGISLHVGSAGTNRGIYDETLGAWMLYYNGTNLVTPYGLTVGGSPVLTEKQIVIYTANGNIINSRSGPVVGVGRATVRIVGNSAEVIFTAKIEAGGTATNVYTWGVNRDLLKQLNSNIPTITPKNGNVQFFNSSGAFDATMNGYGGYATPDSELWRFGRVYTSAGATGAWPESVATKGLWITGTLYGTV